MKDCFDMVTDVRGLLNVESVQALLQGGKIYPHQRPSGRNACIDIVISCRGVTNTQIQNGFGVINCYVPTITSGGQQLTDQTTFAKVAKTLIPLIDEQFKSTFHTWLDDTPEIMRDTDGKDFLNIRFRYRSLQSNYKHI